MSVQTFLYHIYFTLSNFKFRGKKKKRGMFWLWGSVASVALALGVGYYIGNKTNNDVFIAKTK